MFGENNALERFLLVNVFFRQMIISGYLIEAVLLTFLSPSREALGVYPEKHPDIYRRDQFFRCSSMRGHGKGSEN